MSTDSNSSSNSDSDSNCVSNPLFTNYKLRLRHCRLIAVVIVVQFMPDCGIPLLNKQNDISFAILFVT